MSKDKIEVNMNVYDIPIVIEELEKAEDTIKQLQQENQQLKENYDRIYNENCKLRGEHNITDISLLDENQQLKKQKDDVVENAKEKIKRYESYINDLKNGNYPSPTVRQERQELIFRIKEQKDLLRMLGEIDEQDLQR